MAGSVFQHIALVIVLGCEPGPSPETQARIDSLSYASGQRDRLLQEVAENTRLMSEISRELAKVNIPARQLKVSGESPLRASRDTLIQKIRYMTARVEEIQPRLSENEHRISELTALSDSLRTALKAKIHRQTAEIASIVKGLRWGKLAFNKPDSMYIEETRGVQLLLGSGTLKVTERGPVRRSTVQVSPVMEARLEGAGFDVKALSSARQAYDSLEMTEWKWDVTATRPGLQRLTLVLNKTLRVEGTDEVRAVRSFTDSIMVRVSWRYRIASLVGTHLEFLLGGILTPLFIWLVKRMPVKRMASIGFRRKTG